MKTTIMRFFLYFLFFGAIGICWADSNDEPLIPRRPPSEPDTAIESAINEPRIPEPPPSEVVIDVGKGLIKTYTPLVKSGVIFYGIVFAILLVAGVIRAIYISCKKKRISAQPIGESRTISNAVAPINKKNTKLE